MYARMVFSSAREIKAIFDIIRFLVFCRTPNVFSWIVLEVDACRPQLARNIFAFYKYLLGFKVQIKHGAR
jgi:hypothetical protein